MTVSEGPTEKRDAAEVPAERVPPERTCVDADVHPTVVGGMRAAIDYMSSSWRRRFESISLPTTRFDSHIGTLRRDAESPDGDPPGASPAFVGIDLLDRHQVSDALLVSLEAGRIAYLPGRAESAKGVAAFNDLLADRWLGEDRRFHLAITVSPRDPELAAEEIARWGRDERVAAVYLPLANVLMGEPYYHPIYSAAQEYGLPVLSHPGTGESEFQGAPTLAGGVPSGYAQRHVMLPQVAQSNVVSLIFEGTFESFPGLRVVFAEYGFSWMPHVLWRMDKDWRGLRAQVPWVKKSPLEYVFGHIWVTSQPVEEPPDRRFFQTMLEMMNAERTLVFSSDYPHWDNDMPRATFAGIAPDLRQRILVDNAVDALRL